MSDRSLLDDSFPKLKDGHLLGLQEDTAKLEISLNTTGYKPEELKVKVSDGEVKVEGRHEERSEEGEVKMERQFCRIYTLPHGAEQENIESKLSHDGVMLITVPKKKHFEEVKEMENIKVVQGDQRTGEKERETNMNRGVSRVEEFERSGEIQRRRKSLSKVEDSRESCVVKEVEEGLKVEENMKESETKERVEKIRNTFLDDPFFKNTLCDIENTDFIKKARHNFEESIKNMESRLTNCMNLESSDIRSEEKWTNPRMFNADFDSIFDHKDINTIQPVEDETKLEVHLDTTGYRPDELKVKTRQGVITVEGRHEEKNEAGQVMVTRQFCRQFGLPQRSMEEGVVSSLSKDGVLVVTVPKQRSVRPQESRNV